VLVCGPDPEDESTFVLVQDKNSFGPRPTSGRAYRIDGVDIESHGDTFRTSAVVWLGEVQVSSHNLLAKPEDERTSRQIAEDLILTELEVGSQSWAVLAAGIESQGVSEHTGRRARDDLKRAGEITTVKTAEGRVWQLDHPDGQVEGGQVEILNGYTEKSEIEDPTCPHSNGGQLDLVEGGMTPQVTFQDYFDECPDCPKCDLCGFGPDRHLAPPDYRHAFWCEYHPDNVEEPARV
jgi:hypothetical protein